jgi:crossover junction endodeoxyribonuclease RuvC
MRVLGIDPGSRITGFGIVQVSAAGRLAYIDSGCVRTGGGSQAERLKIIYDGVREVIDSHRPDVIAIEKVFMARNADSALKLGQARGAAICAVIHHQLEACEYTALQIKRAVVGNGQADKQQVQHMVRALLGLSGAPQADAADALACAICHAHTALGRAAFTRALRIAR